MLSQQSGYVDIINSEDLSITFFEGLDKGSVLQQIVKICILNVYAHGHREESSQSLSWLTV